MSNVNSQRLYLADAILKLNGVDAPETLMGDILEIVVDESLNMPCMFTLKVHNVYLAASDGTQEWKNDKYFNIGDSLSIGFKPSITEDIEFLINEEAGLLIDGEITGLEVDFLNNSQAHIIVTGYDVSHRLHRGRYNRSFTNCTDSDIVKRIAEEIGIVGPERLFLDPSGATHEYVFQENQTNMEFLRERAARIGFEFFIQNNKLYFRDPLTALREAELNLEWLREIKSFNVRVTSAEQVNSVEVNSWDYSQKVPISGTATTEKHAMTVTPGNGLGSGVSQAFRLKQPPKMIVVDQPVNNSLSDANQMAQALYDELSREFVTADAKADGNPKIRAGRVISLELGPRYTGKYYVTDTRHRYSKGVYKTDFAVRGLRPGSLLSTLPPKTHLQPGQTLLVGLVTNSKDPKGWGRVKVKYPTLNNNDESQWARVVGLGAAVNRGFYCLPEVNDEVLIGFEHGDIHRPYVIGGVWNGVDKTVETVENTINQAGQVRLRTIRTRTGHTIQFVEEDLGKSKAGIYIKTKGKHRIALNDSKECIEIKTAEGNIIRMDDNLLSHGITIESTLGHKVHINDTFFNIVVETRLGQSITLFDGPLVGPQTSITVATPGHVNVEAAMSVNLNSIGFVNIKAGGFVNLTAGGMISAKSAGPISLASASTITLQAPTIALAAPAILCGGVPVPEPVSTNALATTATTTAAANDATATGAAATAAAAAKAASYAEIAASVTNAAASFINDQA